jgi:hypothetical protein
MGLGDIAGVGILIKAIHGSISNDKHLTYHTWACSSK